MQRTGRIILASAVLALLVLASGCGKRISFDQNQLLREINESGGISNFVATGVFHRIEVRSDGVSLIVGPMFYRLPFEKKALYVQTVSGLVGPSRGGDHFLLYDWQTDKKVGSWMNPGGLQLE